MPVCKRCHVMRSTADMRKSTTDGWLCRDKIDCKQRVKQRKADAVHALALKTVEQLKLDDDKGAP